MSSYTTAVKLVANNEHTGGNLQDAHSQDIRPDWSFGLITGHRLRVVFYFLFLLIGFYALQEWLWPTSMPPATLFDRIWSRGDILWLAALPAGILSFIGLMAFRHPSDLDQVQPMSTFVAWRIVSRGTNAEALRATIERCREEMRKTPLFPYIIEVITDEGNSVLNIEHDDVRLMQVPAGYATSQGSLFKARGLHYAMEYSPIPSNAWIVHLDEETRPTRSGVQGICKMIQEEERSGRLRIGQGAIIYQREWRKHPFLTLADMGRTGDDYARFYFQQMLGATIFGLHGSFIVVRNDIEKSIGFDFGPEGSITEDAWWALRAMEAGYRSRWVEGHLEEQSTQSVMDLMRQRRRWFQGLIKVALHTPVSWQWRIPLAINSVLWAITSFSMFYTVLRIFHGVASDPWIQAPANISLSLIIVIYLIGLRANLDALGVHDKKERLWWLVLQLACIPVFSFIESAAIVWGLFSTPRGFHVVKK
ncbi:MAG TPA: glycosyltransferase family 2 protein [Candidatus Paceibacterota bacterium]|nr:glycosyltransferase family 2 protein [Candidatus Paceibacterota bacterium]